MNGRRDSSDVTVGLKGLPNFFTTEIGHVDGEVTGERPQRRGLITAPNFLSVCLPSNLAVYMPICVVKNLLESDSTELKALRSRLNLSRPFFRFILFLLAYNYAWRHIDLTIDNDGIAYV